VTHRATGITTPLVNLLAEVPEAALEEDPPEERSLRMLLAAVPTDLLAREALGATAAPSMDGVEPQLTTAELDVKLVSVLAVLQEEPLEEPLVEVPPCRLVLSTHLVLAVMVTFAALANAAVNTDGAV
jgi:hypothetical protein